MNTRNLVPNMAVAHMKRSGVAIIFVAIAMFLTAAFAGEGHDHGDAAPAATGTGSPRVSSHSDLFELVGIVDAGAMTIYLDRHATNEPVTGAKVEVEAGAAKGVATPQADGTYRFEHPVFKEAAALAVSFTVLAGLETDLLAGDLTLKESHGGHDDEHAARPWRRWAAYAAAGLALLAVAATLMRRKYNQRSQIAIYFIACLRTIDGRNSLF